MSGSLNMCHHVRILGIVIWPLPGSCGRGWWTRRDQREGACVSHQKTTRTREAAFPGGKEGRGLELCKGRDTADIQQSWWSLYRPHGHHTPGGYHSPWGCLNLPGLVDGQGRVIQPPPASDGRRTDSGLETCSLEMQVRPLSRGLS